MALGSALSFREWTWSLSFVRSGVRVRARVKVGGGGIEEPLYMIVGAHSPIICSIEFLWSKETVLGLEVG